MTVIGTGGCDWANLFPGNKIVPKPEERTVTRKEAKNYHSSEADTKTHAEEDVHATQARPMFIKHERKRSETPGNMESSQPQYNKPELTLRTRSAGNDSCRSGADDSVTLGTTDQENINRKEGTIHDRAHRRSGSKELEAH